MKRENLEHIIRAAGTITNSDKIVIIGSQAILGSTQHPPGELVVSQEADIFPLNDWAKSDLIDGSIGELSPFHEEFGYYAHGVGPETATLPDGWQDRLIPLVNENTRGVTGLCLHPADIAISKILAGREKDFRFVETMLSAGLVSVTKIRSLYQRLPQNHQGIVERFLTHAQSGPHNE